MSADETQQDKSSERTDQVVGATNKVKPIKIPAVFGADTLKPANGDLDEAGRGRKSSISFQDTCDLYEIDLEKAEQKQRRIDQEQAPQKPGCFRSLRYYVILMALISPFVVTYSRTIINFAITDMIDPEMAENNQQQPPATTPATSLHDITTQGDQPAYFDLDNSCPVSESDRQRLLEDSEEDKVRAHSSHGEKFKWDGFSQGLLKAAYTIGHTPFQLPGSRLSEIYGPYRVMNICTLLIGLLCLLAPYMAALNFYLLFTDLILLGFLGSFMTPALITMFSNWLTPSERSLAISFYLVASRLGSAWSSLFCGLLFEYHFSWRYVFFTGGAFSLLFFALFSLGARSRPQDHPLISSCELDYLAKKNKLVREGLAAKQKKKEQREMKVLGEGAKEEKSAKEEDTKKKKKPFFKLWLSVLSYTPVWAFILTKFCVKMSGDVVQIELPTYLKRVMHFSAKSNGLVNFRNYVIFCAGCLSVGALVKVATKRRPLGLSKTALRKIFQATASFGVALSLLGLALSVCHHLVTECLLIFLFFVTTFSIGGEGQMPIDLTERYSGTLHSMASTISISGAVAPALVGYYVKGHESDKGRWQVVWVCASILASLGGLIFLIFGEATLQPFEDLELESPPPQQNGVVAKQPEVATTTSQEGAHVNESYEKDKEEEEEQEENKEKPHRESVQI